MILLFLVMLSFNHFFYAMEADNVIRKIAIEYKKDKMITLTPDQAEWFMEKSDFMQCNIHFNSPPESNDQDNSIVKIDVTHLNQGKSIFKKCFKLNDLNRIELNKTLMQANPHDLCALISIADYLLLPEIFKAGCLVAAHYFKKRTAYIWIDEDILRTVVPLTQIPSWLKKYQQLPENARKCIFGLNNFDNLVQKITQELHLEPFNMHHLVIAQAVICEIVSRDEVTEYLKQRTAEPKKN